MRHGLVELLGNLQFWRDTKKITVQAPGAIAEDFSLTLPDALPDAPKALTVAPDGVMGFANVGTQVHRSSFVATDLTNGALTITHGLNNLLVLVQVFSDADRVVSPDYIFLTDNNNCWISVESWDVSGTWNVVIVG